MSLNEAIKRVKRSQKMANGGSPKRMIPDPVTEEMNPGKAIDVSEMAMGGFMDDDVAEKMMGGYMEYKDK